MIGPNVTFIGDPTLGRTRREGDFSGVVVGRRVRIATGAILTPPVQVGDEAFIGANSFVNADVAARTVVVGTPARFLRNVRDDELLGDRVLAAGA